MSNRQMSQAVARGKGTLSSHGLLWGRMLDPDFVPSKDSALLPPPPPPPTRPSTIPTAASRPVKPAPPNRPPPPTPHSHKSVRFDDEVVVGGGPPLLAPSKEHNRGRSLGGNSQHPGPSSSLTPTQLAIHDWIRRDLGVETCVVTRKGVDALLLKPPPFTTSSLCQLMQYVYFLHLTLTCNKYCLQSQGWCVLV